MIFSLYPLVISHLDCPVKSCNDAGPKVCDQKNREYPNICYLLFLQCSFKFLEQKPCTKNSVPLFQAVNKF